MLKTQNRIKKYSSHQLATKNLLLYIGVFIFSLTMIFENSNAQDNQFEKEIAVGLQQKLTGTIYQRTSKYPGSEFLFDTWQLGSVLLKNGQTIENLQLNYNGFSDELVYSFEDQRIIVVSKYQLAGFRIYAGNRTFLLKPSSLFAHEKNSEVYLEMLTEGPVEVFAKREIRISSTLASGNQFGESVFYSVNSYYALHNGNCIIQAQKMRSYYPCFDKAEVKKLVRKHQLKLSDERDLVKFASLLGTIVPNSL